MQNRRIVALLALLTIFAWSLSAQSDRGTITGTIADPAGAVVASAAIQLRNIDTGAVYQGASSATGNYTLAQLPAGQYEMSVEVPGFKKYVQTGIVLVVNNNVAINVTLQVGQISETVEVEANVALVETRTPSPRSEHWGIWAR